MRETDKLTGRKLNRLSYTQICEWCGKHFDCSRPDAKSCGNVCKLRFNEVEEEGKKAANGNAMKYGPCGEWSKCLEALQPNFNGHHSYSRRGSQK